MSIDKEVSEYTAKSGRSRVLHEEALAVMPGGNSRTTTFFDPYPFAIQRGQGAHVWDVDGVDRLDFNGNYTSLILGHAPPDVGELNLAHLCHVTPGDKDFPGVRLEESQNVLEHDALAHSAPPQDHDHFAAPHLKTHVDEDWLVLEGFRHPHELNVGSCHVSE